MAPDNQKPSQLSEERLEEIAENETTAILDWLKATFALTVQSLHSKKALRAIALSALREASSLPEQGRIETGAMTPREHLSKTLADSGKEEVDVNAVPPSTTEKAGPGTLYEGDALC